MAARWWIAGGWLALAIAASLAFAAIFKTMEAVNRTCMQPFVTSGTCPGSGAEFMRGLICAVLAGVGFFSGLACFLWAAHLRTLRAAAERRQPPAPYRIE
jgi:hypothetical protein